MKIDETVGNVILDIASKLNIDKDKIVTILNAHNKGIKLVIEKHVPFMIKVDFFGKIIYNNAHKAKMDEIRALNTPIKIDGLDFNNL